MTTRARARGIFDRSRVLLDRSRVVAAHLLDPPRHPVRPPRAIEAGSGAWADAARDGSLVDVFASIALRDLNLIDTLLAELEEMEREEGDSKRLGQLYRLDHLAARLRRNAENLRVLADRDAGESGGDTTSILDTIRGAMSSIDQYARVGIGRMVPLGVVGFAADDLSRVLTELLDNAANHSPPNEPVRVSAHLTEQGSVLIRIEDGGIGLPPDRLADLNGRLSRAVRLDDDAVRHMGLAVVRRLAERHDLRVSLQRRLPHGTTATVLVPPALVTELPEVGWSGSQTVPGAVGSDGYPLPEPREPVLVPADAAALDVPALDVPALDAPALEVPASVPAAPSGLPRRGVPAASGVGVEPVVPPVTAESPVASPVASPPSGPVAAAPGGTTASGLPRRVSRSIKHAPEAEDAGAFDAADPGTGGGAPELGGADPDGQEKFLADLGDFAEGEQAARAAAEGAAAEGAAAEGAAAEGADDAPAEAGGAAGGDGDSR